MSAGKGPPGPAEVLARFVRWAEARCPCENGHPDPCPLCGATVAGGEACRAADATLPPALLADARAALAAPPRAPPLRITGRIECPQPTGLLARP